MNTIAYDVVSDFKSELTARTARVGIVGMGYVGLPLIFQRKGIAATAFDIDESKVERLNAGGSYIARILPEEVQKAQQSGFTATTDLSVATHMDAIIICVPTHTQ